MKYLLKSKVGCDAYVAHMDRLAPIPIPELEKDLRRGSRCNIPFARMLAQHWCEPIRHPTKEQYAFPVGAECEKHTDHIDQDNMHKFDLKGTIEKLPAGWDPDVKTEAIPL